MHPSSTSQSFSSRIEANRKLVEDIMGGSSDFVSRELTIGRMAKVALFYLDGAVDRQTVQDSVIAKLLACADEPITLSIIRDQVLPIGEVEAVQSVHQSLQHVLSGSLLLLIDGFLEGLILSIPGWETRGLSESKTQPVVNGPQDALNEALNTNITLVRRRIKDTRMRVSKLTVGTLTKTDVAIVYLDGIASQQLVGELTKQLQSFQLDRVLEGQYLEETMTGSKKKALFPLLYQTDRPDTIAAGILDGKVALIIDGTPFALLAPSVFADFIQSAEDYYQPSIFSSLIRMLRYLAFLIGLLAPSVYIALTTFHQDMIPTQLLLSLAAQREGIPFPAFVEALLMETTFEILREAGIRMPRTIGQAVSIVGTIVVGQAAVEANIVSPVMVIVVSITAISSFVIPSYAMSIPIRIFRFVFMALAAAFGVYGITIGFLFVIVHLCSLDSFGTAYMNPYAPFSKKGQKDAIFRRSYSNDKVTN